MFRKVYERLGLDPKNSFDLLTVRVTNKRFRKPDDYKGPPRWNQLTRYGAQNSSSKTRHALVVCYHPVYQWHSCLGFVEQCDSTGKLRDFKSEAAVELVAQPPPLVCLQEADQCRDFDSAYSAYFHYPNPSPVNRDELAAAFQHRVRVLLGKEPDHLRTEREVYLDFLALIGLLKVHLFSAGTKLGESAWLDLEKKLCRSRLSLLGEPHCASLLGLHSRVMGKQKVPAWVGPWEKVLPLVSSRQCELIGGQAFISKNTQLVEVIISTVWTGLSDLVEKWKVRDLPWDPANYDRLSLRAYTMLRHHLVPPALCASVNLPGGAVGTQSTDPACLIQLRKMQALDPGTLAVAPLLRFNQRRLLGQLALSLGESSKQMEHQWRGYFRKVKGDRAGEVALKGAVGFWRSQEKHQQQQGPSCVNMGLNGLCPIVRDLEDFHPVPTCRKACGVPQSQAYRPKHMIMDSRALHKEV